MNTYRIALWLLILGNLAASLSDVSVKMLHGDVGPFQYMFLRQFISFTAILPLWWRQPRAQRALHNPGITALRGHLVLMGSGCMLMAVTYLPLATANAVFYASPLLMLPLSIILLKEKPGLGKVVMTVLGFIGVLVVIRPSQFHWAVMFALGTAITLALFNILARQIPAEQTVITTLMWTSLFSLPCSGTFALWQWQPIDQIQLGWVISSALLILTYNGLAVAAYQRAPASQIALAEYSGLIFVALMGTWWFNEMPDTLTWLGITLIILPLLPVRVLQRANIARNYLLRPKSPSDKRKNITD
ncbi:MULTISPECIES: DMT family transporter [unclassified Vibrio]|uniref:DMT family transporter n=1 Tax=unclassified Vibrio TaxID=2614977 RepID=UPI001482FB89|nr:MULTISPECIES: DMT family transporter [unclassified Vibrio]NNN45632.1 DMT family transporter [Vibrio sp. 1-1(7)]NNN73461.1 DMT family transporter [Vibrio sp. 12-2(3-a)]